jgi:hypothetical protein
MTTLLRDLEKDFALKDLGELHYFLGIELKGVRMAFYSHKKDMQLIYLSVSI